MKTKREKLLALVLSVILLAAVWKLRPATPSWKGDNSPSSHDTLTEIGSVKVVPLRVSELQNPMPVYRKAKRNLFGFGQVPIDPEELERRRREAEALRNQAETAAKKRSEAAEKQAKLPTEKPLPHFPLVFVGYVGPLDNKIAIFRDGKIFRAARRGDVIKKTFIVGNIDYDMVEIGYLGIGNIISVPLSEGGSSTFNP